MRFTTTLAAGALAASASALDPQNYLGFNTGAMLADNSAKFKEDFLAEFETAAALQGAPGKFNAARLYTNIQAYSQDDPIEAFEAAIETKTKLLLGVWASGTDNIDKEISALKKAVEQHGSKLTDLVIGINIGSEDLYRVSVTGIKNKSGPGNSPDAIVGFIDDWKKAFKDTALAKIPIGHADTWDAWQNTTNKAVIDAIDFVAVHEYPYYENDKGNDIQNAGSLFDRAYQIALDAAGDKPVWVTETGWPYTGPDWDEAEASVKNAKKYWDEVGCRKLFNKVPTFWYTLRDSNSANKMKFAITENLSTKPLFDLSCPTHFDTPDSTSTTEVAKPTKTSGSQATTMTTAGSSSTSEPTSDGSESDESDKSDETPAQDGAGSEKPATKDDDEGAANSVKISAFGMLAAIGGALALF